MHSGGSDRALPRPRFRIQRSPDRRSFASSPELIAGYHVFHRFSMPRHPPYTLKSLTTFTDHRHEPLPRRPLVRTGGEEEFRQGVARRTRQPHQGGAAARSATDQHSPKKVLDDARPTEKTKSTHRVGDTTRKAGAGIAEDHPVNLAAKRRPCSPEEPSVEPHHSLVKERLSLYYGGFWPQVQSISPAERG